VYDPFDFVHTGANDSLALFASAVLPARARRPDGDDFKMVEIVLTRE